MVKKVLNIFSPISEHIKKFDEKSNRNKRINYYLLYTLVFAVTSLIVFSWFYLNEKTFVWRPDGLEQHYTALVYFGQYLRQIIRTFFETGAINVPMWDFNIGYGSDILTTLHYYAIGEPLALLSVFVPSAKTEILYGLLVILRLYLSGFAFSAYCNKIGRGRFPTLCGAFVYAFCGFVLIASVRHPFFINPMIYLPLILIGIEKILEKKRPYVFIIMVFISAISSFYFFYMLVLITVLYVIVRMIFMYKEHKFRNIAVNILKFAGYSLIGMLMACFIVLPNIMELLSTQRMGVETVYDLFYPITYYQRFLSGFISPDAPGYWSEMGYTAISLIAIIFMFTAKKKQKELKTAFVILTLFLMFPIVGHVMHGFSYVSNRWIWGYSFVVALILTTMLPSMLKPTKKQLISLSVFSAIYLAFGLLMRNTRKESFLASFAIFLLSVILMFGIYISRTRPNSLSKYSMRLSQAAVLFLVIAGIAVNAGYKYSYNEGNYISQFADFDRAYTDMSDTGIKAVTQIEDKSVFRFDDNRYGGQRIAINSSIPNNVKGTSYYFSLTNNNISSLREEVVLDNDKMDFWYKGTDSRAAVSTLASVKYFVIKSGLERYLPYGYKKTETSHTTEDETEYVIYKNSNTLPFGYTYSSYIPRDSYEELSPLDKQEVLLQGAVLDKTQDKFSDTELILSNYDIPYTIECTNGIEYEDGKFIVTNKNGNIKLSFDPIEDCELYVYFDNMHFSGMNPLDVHTDEEWEEMSAYDRNRLQSNNKYWVEPTGAVVKAKSGGVTKQNEIKTPKYSWYNNKHEFLMNLCYSEKTRTEVTVTFDTIGEYSFDDMQIIAQPMDNYVSQVKALKEDVLEKIKIKDNIVTGTISLDEEKLLCLSIPYSKGWTAYVNGEKAELLRVNTMYCGVFLDSGSHDIKLKYRTPGIEQGLVASAVGFVVLIGIAIFFKIKQRENKN